jgi:hypothetical protein
MILKAKIKFKEPIKVGSYIYTSKGCAGYGMLREDEGKVFQVLALLEGGRLKLEGSPWSGSRAVRMKDVVLATPEQIRDLYVDPTSK